jgi:hypothetical protein
VNETPDRHEAGLYRGCGRELRRLRFSGQSDKLRADRSKEA